MLGTSDKANKFVEWCQGELQSRGWSQRVLAEKGDIDTGHLSRILGREKDLTFDTAVKIAQGFGMESPIPVFVIAQLIPPPEETTPTKEVLLAAFDQLSENDQETIAWLARSLLAKEESRRHGEEGNAKTRFRNKSTKSYP